MTMHVKFPAFFLDSLTPENWTDSTETSVSNGLTLHNNSEDGIRYLNRGGILKSLLSKLLRLVYVVGDTWLNKRGVLVKLSWEWRPKYSQINVFQWHFFHQKSHIKYLGTETGLTQRQTKIHFHADCVISLGIFLGVGRSRIHGLNSGRGKRYFCPPKLLDSIAGIYPEL
jgi:hypothetical protein